MEVVWNCDNSYVLPSVSLTESEGRVSELYELNASTYKDEYTVNYIIGNTTMTFDQFVAQMKSTYHVDDLVSVYQAAYGRYLER